MHWWLPNDEGYPPIIRSIRKFVEERTSNPVDLPGEDLRDMKAIFASLKLDDGQSSLPPNLEKGKGSVPDVAVAGGQEWSQALDTEDLQRGIDPAEGDQYGYDDAHGYWGGDQSTGSYGFPKQEFP